MVIEILNKMCLVLRKGWLRKKKIKIWLIHYILVLPLSLTSPNKSLLLKKSCCCWWKCPLASCTVLDIKPTPCVGGPHSRKHSSLGSGDEGAAQPFHANYSSFWISFNCSILETKYASARNGEWDYCPLPSSTCTLSFSQFSENRVSLGFQKYLSWSFGRIPSW